MSELLGKERKEIPAEFWINHQGKFVHIRYFPVYLTTVLVFEISSNP